MVAPFSWFYGSDSEIVQGATKKQVLGQLYRTRTNLFGHEIFGRLEREPLCDVKDSCGLKFFQFHVTRCKNQEEEDRDAAAFSTISINLNPKSSKTGRPRTDKKEQQAQEKKRRAVFNESQEHRRKMGDVTLVQLAQSLQVEKLSLRQTLERVAIPEKFENSVNKRPKFVLQAAPVLNESAYYILPHKLLLKCKSVLPTKNTPETAISVFSQSQPSQDDADVTKPGRNTDKKGGNTDNHGRNTDVKCVDIVGIGKFSRAQIEAMPFLSNKKIQSEEGLAFCAWLEQKMASDVPAARQGELREMTQRVAESNPNTSVVIQGLTYQTAMLYRLKLPGWADSALISAFCGRLCDVHTKSAFVGVQEAVTGKKTITMDEKIKARAQVLLKDADVLMIPVNFGNTHWCCIVVEVNQGCVLFYDSMNQKSYKTVLDRISWDLAKTLSDKFVVTSHNFPIQTDGYNCGFYIMLKMWRLVDKNLVQDVSQSRMNLLRFRILQFVLTGSTY